MELDKQKIQDAFFAGLAEPEQLFAVFHFVPGIYLFAKDEEGRFVFVNRALAEALGRESERSLIGSTDHDLFDPHLADRDRDEDRRVMKTREPLIEQVWLVPDGEGTLRWYLSSKVPLIDREGEVTGIVGVMRDFERAGAALGPYRQLSPVLAHLQENYGEDIRIERLAEMAGMSVSTLERRFRDLFQQTPSQYLRRVRLQSARRALVETDTGIGEIAIECGFYDQSHFTKNFRAVYHMTPTAFRKKARQPRS